MARALIGRTVRRLRTERELSQQALAARLGISASYLNLIEHDQRAVTASLLIKLGETLQVDLATLSGSEERQIELGLREVFADALLGAENVPEDEIAALAGSAPNAARAVLSLYRAWRVAREDASGIALPSGRRVLLPNEEARDFFDDHANHFPPLETASETILRDLGTPLLIHQPSYSMLNRWVEDELLDTLDGLGVGCIAFSPLAQGMLTDRYLDGVPADSRASKQTSLPLSMLNDATMEHVRALAAIASDRGQSLAQMAIAWVLRDPRITSALIGASSVAQLDQNLETLANLSFSDEELTLIDQHAVESGIDLWRGAATS